MISLSNGERRRVRRPSVLALALALALASLPALFLAFPGPAIAEPYEADPDLSSRDSDYAAGKQAVDRKDWGEAARRFEKASIRYPENADLHNYLGYANRNLKRFDLAFKHYKQAIALDPRHRGAHEYIGETYLLTGDVAAAERHLGALREICLLPCEQLTDLESAIKAWRSKASR